MEFGVSLQGMVLGYGDVWLPVEVWSLAFRYRGRWSTTGWVAVRFRWDVGAPLRVQVLGLVVD